MCRSHIAWIGHVSVSLYLIISSYSHIDHWIFFIPRVLSMDIFATFTGD